MSPLLLTQVLTMARVGNLLQTFLHLRHGTGLSIARLLATLGRSTRLAFYIIISVVPLETLGYPKKANSLDSAGCASLPPFFSSFSNSCAVCGAGP